MHTIGLMLRVLVEGKISIHLIGTTVDDFVKKGGVKTVTQREFFNSL